MDIWSRCVERNLLHKNADNMVILCMEFYGLLNEIVSSHDNQNDIELVIFSVVCNVHSIINHWNCSRR